MDRIAVIGAGIVGLSCAFYLREAGAAVTVVDPDPAGDKASFGNAAGLAVTECVPACLPGQLFKVPRWLLDPLGPLFIAPRHAPRLTPWLWAFLRASRPGRVEAISQALACLNDRVYADYAPLLEAVDYHGHIHRQGAVVAYGSRGAFEADALEWELKARRGVQFETLDAHQLRKLEPSLSKAKTFGVYQPAWSPIDDPRDLLLRLGRFLEDRQVAFWHQRAVNIDAKAGRSPRILLANGDIQGFDHVVVAAGAWSKALAHSLGDRCLLESERGYNTTLPHPGVNLRHEVVFAEEKFVATPMALGLRIGGAAEFAGLTAPANYRRSDALLRLAHRFVDGLDDRGGQPWMGHRPTTPDSLPVIGPSPTAPGVCYAFGHSHLGLTQGPTTGRLVADHVMGHPNHFDLDPYSIARFGGGVHNTARAA
ncbi:MAG: NAD(P)/FAD-dependent oxidoreductase [Candidatus Competibacterales bacterium]